MFGKHFVNAIVPSLPFEVKSESGALIVLRLCL